MSQKFDDNNQFLQKCWGNDIARIENHLKAPNLAIRTIIQSKSNELIDNESKSF